MRVVRELCSCITDEVGARFTRVFTTRNDLRGGRVESTTGAIQTGIVIVLVVVLVLDDGAIEPGTPKGF